MNDEFKFDLQLFAEGEERISRALVDHVVLPGLFVHLIVRAAAGDGVQRLVAELIEFFVFHGCFSLRSSVRYGQGPARFAYISIP